MNNPDLDIQQGFLFKKSRKNPNKWHSRYCVSNPLSQTFTYAHSATKKPVLSIPLSDINLVSKSADSRYYSFTIKYYTEVAGNVELTFGSVKKEATLIY